MIAWAISSLFGLLLLCGTFRYFYDKFTYKLPPGPLPLPFIGSAHLLRRKPRAWEVFNDISKDKRYGHVATFYMGQYRMILLNGAKAINEALVQQGRTFSDRPVSIVANYSDLPIGVALADGKEWQSRRRFCLKALRDFGMGKSAIVDKIHDEVEALMEEFSSRSDSPFDTKMLLINSVSNVICSLVFGKRFSYDDTDFVELTEKVQFIVSRPVSKRALLFMFPFLRYFFKPIDIVVAIEIQNSIDRILRKAVQENRKDFVEGQIRDFPDVFIQSELSQAKDEVLDYKTFAAVMMDLFIAGTETTSTALQWTLLYLTKFPEVQQKCHDAIDRVIGTNRLPSLADRSQLVYIEALMCEVLRHSTIVPLALLHCNLDNDAKLFGYDIPKRSMINYNVWALHNSTYWDEPRRFDPNRWIDGTSGKLLTHSGHFAAFGLGPRICLGESLARVEYFIFLVSILQRFSINIENPDSVSIENGIVGSTYAPPPFNIIISKR